jgi:signal transduction histidine kinase
VNLVGNAFKHTPPEATIDVFCDAAPADDHVRISVRDTGPGIPKDKHERIFEPFVQLERRLSRPVEGLGLGLAIARDMARGMGGDLTVAGDAGEGTTFVLTLRAPRFHA